MKKHIFKAYWPSFRRYWLLWATTLVALVISVSLQGIAPYYVRGIVDTFTSSTPDVALAMELFGQMLLVFVGILISYRIFDFAMSFHSAYAMRDLDDRSFEAMQRQSMSFFEDAYSGSLVTKARRFRSSYDVITDLFFFQFGKNAVMLVVVGIVFMTAMPALILPFIGWTVLFFVYIVVVTLLKYPCDKAVAELDSKVGAVLADSLTNHLAVKTFGQEAAEAQRFAEVTHESQRLRLRAWLYGNFIITGQVLVMAFGDFWLIWWMIQGWEQGLVTAGDFVFVQTFLAMIVSHLWPLGENLRRFFSAVAEAEEMAVIHQLVPEVRDAPGARSLFIEDGRVEFHAVRFCYGGKTDETHHAVQNFSLTIPAGQSVGLVGRSGAGKSTLVKLLLRFYDLDSGYIRIDGQDIANVTQASLRQQLAVVPQHPQLFHRTIRDNITFARPDATEGEIIQAAQQAYAWEFIQELSEGLDTLVGERGVKLSGGQQQRIAIARAILADPRILILDEATSALDSKTEKQIQQAIANLLQGRTAIVIAHRLSTIMRLDQIVVMEEGEIIETGTHTGLLEQEGMYADLWAHQSGGYIN